jgi:hypothetical protein
LGSTKLNGGKSTNPPTMRGRPIRRASREKVEFVNCERDEINMNIEQRIKEERN